MPANLDGLIWLLLSLGPLLVVQRLLHREVQAIFLLLTRRPDISIMLFSLLFLPGVLLHEGSHYLMAILLRVRTGYFSILPQPMKNGRLQLGFVETEPSDWLRDALIGIAPLLTGGAFVAYAGLVHLGLLPVWWRLLSGGLAALPDALPLAYTQPDFWIWFYLAVAVSSTMLPSASDRRFWLPIGLTIAFLLLASLLFGAGPWLAAHLAPALNLALLAVAVVFGVSVLIHLVILPPLWGLHCLLSYITQIDIA